MNWAEFLTHVTCRGALPITFTFSAGYYFDPMHAGYLEMVMNVPDVRLEHDDYYSKRSQVIMQVPVPKYIESSEEKLSWLRRQVHQFYQHEADEWFQFDGVAIYDPHKHQ